MQLTAGSVTEYFRSAGYPVTVTALGPPVPGKQQMWYVAVEGQQPHVTARFRGKYPRLSQPWNNILLVGAQRRAAVIRYSG